MPFEARNSGLIKVEFCARNSPDSTVCIPIVQPWVLQRVMGSAREGTMDGMEWNGGAYGAGLLGCRGEKSLNAAKKFHPGTIHLPATLLPFCFCHILLPSFLTFLAWPMTDGGGGIKWRTQRKTWGRSETVVTFLITRERA